MAFDHSKFLQRFVEEAHEHCSNMSEALLNLEHSPGNSEVINGLFRSAHTIKGSSRMMKLMTVTELAHKMEDVLDAVRGNKMPLTQSVATLLFKGIDALLVMLEFIASGNTSPELPEALCEELVRICDAPQPQEKSEQAADIQTGEPVLVKPIAAPAVEHTITSGSPIIAASLKYEPLPKVEPTNKQDSPKKIHSEYLRINADKIDDLIHLMGEIVSEHTRFKKDVLRLRDVERSLIRYNELIADSFGKIELEGERYNQLKENGENLHATLQQSVRAINGAAMMQEHLIGDLQETSLKMRMQPLSIVFDPLRRTVRDLSQEFGKQIEFVVDGGETEMDRKIIDRIGDSLIHLIRNSLDHGLETTEERIAAGKPEQGTITLTAFYDSGCVTIALRDDGKGIPLERIREKALAKKLFDAETLAMMTRSEIINLIFTPGFSTSPIITDLSGRGVGMDVVKKNIADELKGTIFIETKEGEGTTFLLRLPLNLAVFPLFQVLAADKLCTISATSIVEMLAVQTNDLIQIVNKQAIRLREQLIPVERLSTLLGIESEKAVDKNNLLIVIVRDGEEKLGLIVDDLIGREEMVVKPLPDHLKNLRLVSGVSIGERNSILNVLHIPELLKKAREFAEPLKRVLQESVTKSATILVVDDSYNTREIEKSILEANGYIVETAFDGEDGYEKTRGKIYDLVITDVEMPRLDGFSFTEKLRADERYRTVPIIIVTSREKDEDKKRGITVGANAYIVKGDFDQTNLIDTVHSLIG